MRAAAYGKIDVVKIFLVNGAEEGSKIDKAQAEKELEDMTIRFNEAVTSKEKIEATQNLPKARARVQAATA